MTKAFKQKFNGMLKRKQTHHHHTVEWPSQSLDLSLLEMLWQEPKQVADDKYRWNFSHLAELYKEKWTKIPRTKCERLVSHCQSMKMFS